MDIFTRIVVALNILYWLFLLGYLLVRLVGHFDNVRYLTDCVRAEGGRLRVVVDERTEGEPAGNPLGDIVFRETPWFPFVMAFVILFLLLVLCISYQNWSALQTLSSLF